MKWLDNLEEWLITVLIGAATLIVFMAVLHRYLAGLSIPYLQDWLLRMHVSWAQEATIYLFVWMAKFGAAYGVRTGIHVGVDVLINRLPPRRRAAFVLFGLAAGAMFTGILAWLGGYFVWENGAHHFFVAKVFGMATTVPQGPVTPDLEWPTWIVYLAIPLGSSLMCFRFIQVAVSFMRTGELPHHDHGHVEGLEDESNAPDLHPQEVKA